MVGKWEVAQLDLKHLTTPTSVQALKSLHFSTHLRDPSLLSHSTCAACPFVKRGLEFVILSQCARKSSVEEV
jgi:hypothetical protein